jgi:PAS domain S-box-containing protein
MMKRNWILLALTAVLLTVVSFLMFHLHYEGIRQVLSQFERDRLSYAKHFSTQIQFYIQARSQGLRSLSSFPSFQYGDVSQQRRDIEAYAKQIEKPYVKSISLYDEQGTVVCSTDPKAIGSKTGESKFFAWAQQSENRDRISLTPVFPETRSLTFILSTPLYRGVPPSKPRHQNGKFAGLLTFTLDMKAFLIDQLGSADPRMNLDQVWIMDEDGTLLFQPDHPEMVFRNIYEKEGNCRSCHLSFNYIEEILSKRQGTIAYKIKNHPKKIAAFASMKAENISWVVVLNTPYDKVTGFVDRSLREHLFLLGIVVLAFVVGSALVVRNERMKIKVEEEVVRWQEKMAERKKAEEALEGERNKLKGILDSMSDGAYIVNPQYEILYTNPVVEKEFGPVKGRKCYEYFHDHPDLCSWCKAQEVFAGKTVRWEWSSLKTGRTYDIFDTPIMGPDGTLCKLQFIRDISDRKKAEKELRQSENRYRMLVETMNEGLGVQDENGVWNYVNGRFSEMLGYSRDEMIGRPVTDFLGETNQNLTKEQMFRRRRGENESFGLSWLKKDGQIIFTRVSPKAIFDERGQFKGSFAVVTDITERRRTEEAVKESERQLRYLSSRLLTAQETERRRISRELHDELGQSLTVMKLRLNFIEKNLSKDQIELKRECDYGVQYVDQVIENIRRLSRDLSPTILEDFGLSAAVRWLINNFARSYNKKVMLDMIDIDSLLPRNSHVVIYRTVQEALTNIGKHSQAKNVSINIQNDNGAVLFSIEDDGIGFDERVTNAKNLEEKGLGLATMKGRAQMVGGILTVRTQKGEGTLIMLSIPIKEGVTD